MLVRLKPNAISLKGHKAKLLEHSKMNLSSFELKKKTKKERGIEAKSVAVHAIEDKAEELDMKLR